MLGTKVKFSTVFHLKTDAQTKVVNRSLEKLLGTLVDEHIGNWDFKLFTAEFAYNTFVNKIANNAHMRLFTVLDLSNL